MEKIETTENPDVTIAQLIKQHCGDFPLVCKYTASPNGLANAVQIVKEYIKQMEVSEFHYYLAQLESYLEELKNQ